MLVSMNIILDALEQYRYEVHIANATDQKFSGITLLPPGLEDCDPRYLYVSRLSEILTAPNRPASMCCVCIRDRLADETETEETLRGLVIINENRDVREIFYGIQEVFLQISAWVDEMHECIITGRNLQDLLTLSEPIIGNFISISDSALALMAYTKNISCSDCPVSSALIAHGYHDENSVAIFKKTNRADYWNKVTDIYVNNNMQISPYPVMSKVVRYNNTYFTHVVMLCNNRRVTAGLRNLFDILIDHLSFYFERAWDEKRSATHIYDSVLTSLLENSHMSPEIVRDRVQYAELPFNGCFRILRIVPDDAEVSLLQRFGQELFERYYEMKVIIYHQELIVLIVRTSYSVEWEKQLNEKLQEQLAKNHCHCGVSNLFIALTGVREAYQQAGVANSYGKRLTSAPFITNLEIPKHDLIYPFEDFYTYFLLCNNQDNVRTMEQSMAWGALAELQRYDATHNTNNLDLLHVYLNHDRRASDVAALLHMHRNNVVYRISRIEEIVGMDLDNSRNRFRLLMAYEVFKLYGDSSLIH